MHIKKVMPERLQNYLKKKTPKYILLRVPPHVKKQTSPVVEHDPHQYDYYLSLLCTFKNEALNLKVWVDHYLWMGVDHLFLIDNGSDDNCQEILQPYVDKGVVSVFYMPEKYKQTANYRYIYENHIKNKSKWVIIADSDEFWYVKDSTIRKELPKYEQHDVILSQWRNFGTDGHIQHPKDIRTAIVHRHKKLECTKYIFQTQDIKPDQVNIHRIDGKVKNELNANNIFIINHYPIQSEEYFKNIKMVRRSAASITKKNRHNMKYFHNYNNNTNVVDTDLKNMVEKYQTDTTTDMF